MDATLTSMKVTEDKQMKEGMDVQVPRNVCKLSVG